MVIIKIIMVIIKIIFLVIINDHVQDWAWDKTNFLAADISAAEFSIQYNNGLVIVTIIVVVNVMILVITNNIMKKVKGI